jgi:beta-galactosidase
MCHDLIRSLKDKPFFMMESCPSSTNWQGVSKLKKPGILFSQSVQAIAHGGEGALYFQIRQSRGASEKFHGAVIDHYGENDTRVFREVCQTGKALQQLSELAGSRLNSRIAILYDWNSRWAMEDSQGPRNDGLHYHEAVLKCYRGFRRQGLNVDLVDMERLMSVPEGAKKTECILDQYQVLAVPMGYMFKEGFDEKVRAFVENGGILLMTYWSGVADDTDRCYLGGTPHGLMDVLGLRSAEIDGLYDWEENTFEPVAGNVLGLNGTYRCKYLCELVQLRGAEPLMTYGSDFYAGYPALTVHNYGKGKAWYIAADAEEKFYEDFLAAMLKASGISCAVQGEIPQDIEITIRENEEACYYIYQNFGKEPESLPLPEGVLEDVYGDRTQKLGVYDALVVKQKKK